MESLGNQARIEGFFCNLDQNGKMIVLLDDGGAFQALIRSEPDIDPSFSLGSDIREHNIIETLRELVPARMLVPTAQSQIRASCDGVQMVITKRQDNVASPFVSFDVVKIV